MNASSPSVRDSCLSASTLNFPVIRQASGANVGFPSALRPLSPRRCGLSLSPAVGNLSFCYRSNSRRDRSTKTVLVLNGSSSTFEVNEESNKQGLQVAESARGRVEPVVTGQVAWSADGKATILWPTRKQPVKAASANEERELNGRRRYKEEAELTGKVDAQGGTQVPYGGEREDFFLPVNRQRTARLADTIPKRPSTPRRQQSDMWPPSSASRLLIGAPAFNQDAELDALTAPIPRIQGERSSFIPSDRNQFPTGGQVHDVPLHKEDTRQGKSVFPSKLEEILNDFRNRHQREERWRNKRTSKNNADSISQEGGISSPSSVRRSASTLNSSSSWKLAGRDQQSANYGLPINANSSDEFFDAMEDRGKISYEKGDFTMSPQNNAHIKRSHEPLDQLNTSISTPRRSRRGPVSFSETHNSIRNRSSSSAEEQAAKYSRMRNNSTNSNVKSKSKVWVNDKPRLLAREETSERAIKDDLKKYPQLQIPGHRGENFDKDGSVSTASHVESDTEADCPRPVQSKQSIAGLKPVKAEPLMKGGKAAWHSQTNSSLPFEYQFSYSEVPNAPVLRYREKPYSPFGPLTMSRPWTGGPPLEKSKKNRPMFDSFNPPPKGKKGVKYVQDPGPYPPGQGPKPAKSRDEILGEPLTNSEIAMLIDSCQEEKRQLNLGRDGLTHNMLDLIHCHWKRRRVIKIRCLGVPTVDMDNVCFHLEDKTGGKIVYHSGGNVYLFRGRNYNYKDRPEVPLMLWRPISPVYPRLIKRAPTGLTEEEADQLRELGKKVEPLCKLNKNGIYHKLVEDVRVAFKVDELVRIDCRGLNPSDYKKIGAKLKDLVPCVLLSFDNEQILMWKGKETSTDSESSKTSAAETLSEESPVIDTGSTSVTRDLENDDTHMTRALHHISHSKLTKDEIASEDSMESNLSASSEARSSKAFAAKGEQDLDGPNLLLQDSCIRIDDEMAWDGMMGNTEGMPGDTGIETGNYSELTFWTEGQDKESTALQETAGLQLSSMGLDDMESVGAAENLSDACNAVHFDDLWDQAIISGIAVELDDAEMDNDTIVTRARDLAGEVPAGEAYTRKLIRNLQIKSPSIAHPDQELHKHLREIKKMKLERKITRRRSFRTQRVDLQDLPQAGPRHSGMDVDELAQLLSMR